jgi:hypothetical protein
MRLSDRFDHFTKWKSGVFFKEHVNMRPQLLISDEDLFVKIKNDFVAARQI